MQRSLFGLENPDIQDSQLRTVYAQYLSSETFSLALFERFTSLHVLTYSVGLDMIVKMLHRFETIECVFGFEGVLENVSKILAWQKYFSDQVTVAIKGLEDSRRAFVLEKIAQDKIRFYVVKDAISHSKIYLLEHPDRRRVIVGSANLSSRAFSGKQAETIIVFDDDDLAWEHYWLEYEAVRQSATTEFKLRDLAQTEVAFQDIPVLQEASKAKSGVTVFVNVDEAAVKVPTVIHTVERVADQYKGFTQPLVKTQKGQARLDREIVGRIVQLVRSQKREEQIGEKTWLSINRHSGTVLLSGNEISLDTEWADVQSDARYLIEYFENFKNGFYGDVEQHQKDFFMFMCWFYFSPFICELRNHAIIHSNYIFEFPMFAILYGKSNCGKTRLIETLMTSMFGYWQVEDKSNFTRTKLRALLQIRKRFPVAFDDVDKTQFANHAPDIIKDETFILEEYPAFVLSMNAEDHSFATEIRKRCLILYIKASLPDNSPLAKSLYNSVMSIQKGLSTSLYREYLRRVLGTLQDDSLPQDMLRFSSEVLTGILAEAYSDPLPTWCVPVAMTDYTVKRYEKIKVELLKLYKINPALWEIRPNEAILKVPPFEAPNLRKDVPDWVLKEGSRGGNIVMDRKALEEFLGISFGRRRLLGILRL